jgi:5-methylcytosine-specific restriction enzyme A
MNREKVLKWYDLPTWIDKSRCPLCNSKLVKKWEGMVCRNNCPLNFKCGSGWVYIDSERKNNHLFFTSKWDFDLAKHENQKEWLKLKSALLYEKKACEICTSNRFLQVHHVLPRSSNPELSMDKENLMVLCENCHKKIHAKDKYAFRSKI